MPTISYFYGIIILMHFWEKEHNPPHIHAVTPESEATFAISTGKMMRGELPTKAQKLVKEFIKKYQKELMEMWETGKYTKLPPLE